MGWDGLIKVGKRVLDADISVRKIKVCSYCPNLKILLYFTLVRLSPFHKLISKIH